MHRFVLAGLFLFAATTASAQGFVENLFRSIAESQLQRTREEIRRRVDPGIDANVNPRVDRGRPPQPGLAPPVQRQVLPPWRPDYVPPRRDDRVVDNGGFDNRPIDNRGIDGRGIIVDSGATWRSLQRSMRQLSDAVRRQPASDVAARRVAGDVYRLSAMVDELTNLAVAGRQREVAAAYPNFDRDYRTLSYRLRGDGRSGRFDSGGFDPAISQLIGQIDPLVSRLDSVYGTTPQWDRSRMSDIILICQTHLSALLDDLEVISISASQRRNLTHDLRLLHQQLTGVRRRVGRMEYDQIAEALGQFTSRMLPLADTLRSIRNPHVDRRLDRLAELADETYSLLWMQPPVTGGSVASTADRLRASTTQLRQSLSDQTMRLLDRASAARVEDSVRQMERDAAELARLIGRDREDRAVTDLLRRIDGDARMVASIVQYVPGPHHAPLALVGDHVAALQRATGTAPVGFVSTQSLLPSAATLEGTAEAVRDAIRRIDHTLQPSSYRSDLRRASDDFYRASRKLHSVIADRRDNDEIRRRAEALVDPWRTLSGGIDDLRRRGCPEPNARTLIQYRDAMRPAIGEIAAAFGL